MARGITLVSNLFGLDQPFTDPSHYALLSVSSNLDFSNARFLELMRQTGRTPVAPEQGVAELPAEQGERAGEVAGSPHRSTLETLAPML